MYFEYAKEQWASEHEFMIPNINESWVDVAVKGDPECFDRGIVYCRLCRHYNKPNIFGKGYRCGSAPISVLAVCSERHNQKFESVITVLDGVAALLSALQHSNLHAWCCAPQGW